MNKKVVQLALAISAISPLLISSWPAFANNGSNRQNMATTQGAKMSSTGGVTTTSSHSALTSSQTLPTTRSSDFGKYAATAPVLKIGSRGKHVKDVQAFLKREKLYTGSIDGVFGRQLRSAVIAFQQSQRLRADGVVGQRTWAAMSKSQLG